MDTSTIADKLRLAMLRWAPSQQPAAVPPAVALPAAPPVPFEGSMRRESALKRYVATTPEQDAANMAWETGDTNRGELERALATAPAHARPTLAEEYGRLFGPFDPSGGGYDYEGAVAAGMSAGKDRHWPSRDPRTGMIFKGAGHRTFNLTQDAEKASGYDLHRDVEDGRYYSNPPMRR